MEQNSKSAVKSRVDLNYKVWSTLISAILFSIILIRFAYLSGPKDDQYPVTYIICVSGCILGWLIGIITTPYNENDANKIGNFSKMIGTFLSGYLLSKFDGLFKEIMDPATFFSSLTGLRFLLFLSFFILSWIVVFVFRIYTTIEPKSNMLTSARVSKGSSL